MKKKVNQKNSFWRSFGRVVPYLVVAAGIFAVAQIGSENKVSADSDTLSMTAIADSDYNVSADQLSELYVVASLSSSFDLASVDTVSSNYVTVSVMKEISQTSADKIEKPNLVNTNISRGVQTYVVGEGETMQSIANKYRITTDQIRWSNGLKTTDINPGDVLKIPTVAGIVYTVKAGDTVDGVASKYGSAAAQIVAYNDLESSPIVEGMQIVLPGGSLPVTERPEYVVRRPTYNYSYYGSTSDRQGMHVVSEGINLYNRDYGNQFAFGQCTWYAFWWRGAHGMPLPTSLRGNANSWARSAQALGLRVDRNPEYGAVFQTPSGWYGHVGVVLKVNSDGSILVREMNYGYRAYVITESTIPASATRNFNYIH